MFVSSGETAAKRALTSALIGMALFPIIPTAISLYLLLRHSKIIARANRRAKAWAFAAVLVNLVALTALTLVSGVGQDQTLWSRLGCPVYF